MPAAPIAAYRSAHRFAVGQDTSIPLGRAGDRPAVIDDQTRRGADGHVESEQR